MSVNLDFSRYQPINGSSYFDLPPYLESKKAIINVENTDNQCLRWSLLSALHPVDKNAQRVSKYKEYESELKFDGIDFPTPIDQISKVQKQNELATKVFGYDDDAHPLHVTKIYDKNPINLILIMEGENKHYCWINLLNPWDVLLRHGD